MYSHTNHDGGPSDLRSLDPAPGEGPRAPVSAASSAAVATDRRTGLSRTERGVRGAEGERRIRVGIIGATGYVGAELIRLLTRHPNVEIVGLQGRDRDHEPIELTHRHLEGTGLAVDTDLPDVDAVFLALPHGQAASRVPEMAAAGTTVIDLGPDFRLRAPADYPRWYGFEHPNPEVADGCRIRSPGAPSGRARGTPGRAKRDRGRSRLLSNGDDPRACTARACRAHR